MKIYPDSAIVQLEFDKIKTLLAAHGSTDYAKRKAEDLRVHTQKKYINIELQQSHEFKLLAAQGQPFPIDFTSNISRDIKLLGISGSMLTGEQFLQIRSLTVNAENIFRWFDADRRSAYPALYNVVEDK